MRRADRRPPGHHRPERCPRLSPGADGASGAGEPSHLTTFPSGWRARGARSLRAGDSSAVDSPLCGARGGALAPYGTRAPKELLHHLPASILRRPAVFARPPDTPTGVRRSRIRDRRPPAYRCSAVPGLMSLHPGDPDGVRFLRSSLCTHHLPSGHCVPRRARPQLDALAEETAQSQHCCAALLALQPRSCSRQPLTTAGRPVRSSVPSPSCDCLASVLHHRTVMRVLLPGSSCLPGPDRSWLRQNHKYSTGECLLSQG
ncbi:Hypothetical Protein sle_40480 [Streptomyces leeuwenhoekii]|uniref:Uncharacterized protein n=1 Tax=Streptomyces leeuwenhoekii TaxID=1437453 RepID=A0A0F7W134_STRLW|nr:Hypothetical Protein sle_40480 [Streptomyces leeuwenhoekii]